MASQESSERSFSIGELIVGKVYHGTFGGQEVAIKRTLPDKWEPKSYKENYALQRLDHRNVVKLLKSQETNEFR
jgi:hypothetical protein